MSLSVARKRQRELDSLKRNAESLWKQQQDVLEQASRVARDARTQAGAVAREELAPRVRSAFESGAGAVRGAAGGARRTLNDTVVPAVAGAAATALAAIDVARDRDIRAMIARTGGRVGQRFGFAPAVVEPPKKSANPLPWILVGVGVVAAAAVGYAVWQTLRADDELWVEDEELEEGADDLVE